MTSMGSEELSALLWQWGRYVVNGNRGPSNRLVGSYTERIAAGDSWGRDYAPDIDERVIYIAGVIGKMDENYRMALHIRYVLPGPLKRKLPPRIARTDFYAFLKAAHIKVLDAMSDNPMVATIPPNL